MADWDADAGADWDPDGLLAAINRWIAAEQTAEAARERTRQRWLTQQAEETATLAGVLVDLAERRATVQFTTPLAADATWQGPLVGVGRDFVVLERPGRLLTLRAIAALRAEPPLPTRGTGDRAATLEIDLASALAGLAAERNPVRLHVGTGQPVVGDLESVGVDVAVVRTRGAVRASTVVPLAAVWGCTIV